MAYRTILERFNRGRLNPFWVPVARNDFSNKIEIDLTNEFLEINSNTNVLDVSYIRSIFPIVDNYFLKFKFRVDACSTITSFFTIYDSVGVLVPDTQANLQNRRKFILKWDTTTPDLDIMYYNGSHSETGIVTNIPISLDTWYWVYFWKNHSKYYIVLLNNDLTTFQARVEIALSSVWESVNPDYIVFGDVATDTERIDLDLKYIKLIYNINSRQYSNGLEYSNSILRKFS